MRFIAVACAAIAFVGLLAAEAAAMRLAPEMTIDLAKSPAQRWTGAVGKILALHSWEDSFQPLLDYYDATFYNLIPASNRTAVEATVARRFPEEYAELQGIAADFAANGHSEVTVEWLSQWFWFHEISHAAEMNLNLRECTAILALPSDPDAPIVHGRNLDQDPLPSRNITLTLTFINSSAALPGQPAPILFQAVDMYWMSGGFVTGFKSGHVTLQENWRWSDIGPLSLHEIMDRIINDDACVPQVHMFRYALQGQRGMAPEPNFDNVVRFLNTSTFAAPFYGIVSGTQRRGAVLSVSFDQSTNVVMFVGKDDFPTHPWFAVQTNYDQWKPDPGRKRRTHAQDNLLDLRQEHGATHLGVWQAISAYPVHNEMTFYTVVMDVTMAKIRGIIRQPMMPYNAACKSSVDEL